MIDPEKFQQETIKAIRDLHRSHTQLLSRQLALSALAKALVGRLHPAALAVVIEDYEEEIVHQAATLAPDLQRPEFWQEWSDVLEARRKELQRTGPAPGPNTAA